MFSCTANIGRWCTRRGSGIAVFCIVLLSTFVLIMYTSKNEMPKSLSTTLFSDKHWKKSISDPVQERLQSAELSWLKSNDNISEAEKSLKSDDDLIKIAASPGKYKFWKSFTPSFACPFGLERMGRKVGDGGKWVCGFEELAKKSNCVVYSFGINYDSTFEEDIAGRSTCKIHMFELDKKIPVPTWITQYPGRVTYTNLGIGGEDTPNLRTFKTLMSINGDEFADIFKIDIEGGEWNSLEKILIDYPDTLPFGQMQVEVHLLMFAPKHQYLVARNFIYSMERRGLRLFHDERNQEHYREFSFLNIRSSMFKLEEDINSERLTWSLNPKFQLKPTSFIPSG